jgi:glycosyltransferase involved in cell wall biosynthesis
MECRRSTGRIGRRHVINSLAAACWRSALRRHARLREFVKSGDPAVVYAYWGHMPAQAIPIAKAMGAKTCARYHSVDLYLERATNQGFIPCQNEIQAATDLNVFISAHGLEYFDARARKAARGRRVINRLGSPDYGPPAPRPAMLSADPLVVASVSSIGGVKRVHLIARLVRELAKSRRVEWHHFGSGSSEELDREFAMEMSEALAIKMWGDTPRAKIQEFYRANPVTFFVNLSEFEGVPVSIMEALNADIPVVASNVGGTSEAVIDGRSGMLVEPDQCSQADALARRILDALQPGGLLDRSEPRQVWRELYDANANAARMTAHLRRLAEE